MKSCVAGEVFAEICPIPYLGNCRQLYLDVERTEQGMPNFISTLGEPASVLEFNIEKSCSSEQKVGSEMSLEYKTICCCM